MSRTLPSVCPHDCPSACPLDVEVGEDGRIGRIHGAPMAYTQGVICAKVARYAEVAEHPDRLLTPMRRIGAKGEGRFAPIGWDEALDAVAARLAATPPQEVWPYLYAGTMGMVQREALERLRRVMGWSGQKRTICASIAGAGWMAGVGAKLGVDPREILESDLIVIWGANPAATQIHLMGLIARARKTRGAKLVVIDPYRTPTAEKADLHLAIRPGTDGALALGVMHVLFRDGLADRDYLARYTRDADRLEGHLALRNPGWAGDITGLSSDTIEEFAALYGRTKKSLIRVGYGFTRSRNGAVNVHAVSCLPAVTGAWQHQGGGAFNSMSGAFAQLDLALVGAEDCPPPPRQLDMCQLGAVLAGEPQALAGGPPVTAMLVQSSNPALVAPDSGKVRQGLARDDLFLVVHEQMMTATARFADIVLPATTFLEHDDLYASYGQTFLQASRRVIAPRGQARSNHWLIRELARRLSVSHPALMMDEWALIETTLERSKLGGAEDLLARRWIDCAPSFERAHFTSGFGHADGRFRFAADWGPEGLSLPCLPDHLANIDEATPERAFRLVTAPSRHFLNSSFTTTPTSRQLAKRPTALMHADDMKALAVEDGTLIAVSNRQGTIQVHAEAAPGIAPGIVVIEGLWPDEDFPGGKGVNWLVSAEPAAPAGGGVFHDTSVGIERVV